MTQAATPYDHSSDGRVSLIIPTWNEAAWLPRLLSSVQSIPQIRQVIVADNASTDGTPDLAAVARCLLVEGGRPSAARNHGAGVAGEPILLFVDADCVLTGRAVREAVEALAEPDTVGVHVRTVPVSLGWYCRTSYRVMDYYIRMLAMFGIVQGVASFIAVNRQAFEACGGFDEGVGVGEDADFLRRLSREGRVLYKSDEVVFTSARRFHTERPWLFSAKVFMWGALRLLRLKHSIVDYRWEGHAQTAEDEAPALEVLLREHAPEAPREPILMGGLLGEEVGDPRPI